MLSERQVFFFRITAGKPIMFVVGDPPASMGTGKGGKCPVSIASRVRVH